MEIKDMQMADIEARSAELETALTAENADIESITAEVTALEERKAQIVAEAEERKAQLEAVEKTAKEVHELKKEEERNMMDVKEYRNTPEYINAFAEYVKTGNDAECRALLTENVGTTGKVAVPEFVETKVMTAWNDDEIMNRVRKTFIKGNLKVNFEISGTDAVVHTEGSGAVAEETLTLGIITLVPHNIKKWISISDEVYAMGGEAFLDYIYDELSYRIVKKLAALCLGEVVRNAHNPTALPAVATLKQALGAGTIVAAEALLSAEATDVVAVMNRATWGALKAIQITSGQNVGDVFNGLPVVFSDFLPAYESASEDDPYIIVGDLKGITVNFPEGDDVKFKFDELTDMTSDMIRVLGKVYAAHAVTVPNAFTLVTKAA